jgi:hypothetical protein
MYRFKNTLNILRQKRKKIKTVFRSKIRQKRKNREKTKRKGVVLPKYKEKGKIFLWLLPHALYKI